MTCAIYLDPRYKCELAKHPGKIVLAKITIERLWQRIQSAEKDSHEMSEMNQSDKSLDWNGSIDLNTLLADVDRHYDETDSASEPIESATSLTRALDAYDAFVGNTRVNASANVLQFWETHKNTFSSELGKIANTIHAIPPTQSSIERLFFSLNFIYSDRRYNLSQRLLENILLLHSNVDFFNIVKRDELDNVLKNCD